MIVLIANLGKTNLVLKENLKPIPACESTAKKNPKTNTCM